MPAGSEEAAAVLGSFRQQSTATLTVRGRAETHAGPTGTKNMFF